MVRVPVSSILPRVLSTTRQTISSSLSSSAVSSSAAILNFGYQIPARLYHQNIIDHYENPRNVGM